MKQSAAHAWRLILVGFLACAAPALAEDEPLHSLIDRHLAPVSGVQPERASDAEFLRRAALDLIGMPPTADEARAFIAEPAADKRERLIDRLFSSPHFARHLATVLDVMLMERRPNTHVSADQWQAWLLKSVKENKPWNLLAREILAADGDNPAQRAPARFALDRGSEPNLLTRDIGRIFFGRDMQCAQCHDHPLVPEYLQSDYHGLLAFVAPSYALVRTEGGTQTTLQAEKAGNDLTFESVFVKTPRRTGARMPDDVVLDEPFFLPGDEYQVAPAENIKPVPKFSRRAKLAELATNGANEAFNQSIVNRLWAHMFGRGLVHPVDLHHPDNPATNPELLRRLGQRFAAMNFDIRAFLRELALSSAYQRSFDLPAGLLAASAKAAAEAADLQKKRAALETAAEASSKEYEKESEAWQAAEAALLPAAGELDAARNQYVEAKKKVDEAVKAVTDAKSQLQEKYLVAKPVEEAVAAVQQAAKALPENAQLADASQKLTARSQELAAEVAALSKTFEEKTAAIGPPTAALGTATPTIGAALAKAVPLSAAMHQAEQSMVAARSRFNVDAEALAALDRRLQTTDRLAQLPQLQQAIVAANKTVPVRESELAAAQKQLDDYASVIAQNEAAVKTATDAMTAATAGLNDARDKQAKRAEAAQAIAAAFVTAAARPMAFDDTMLTTATTKLQDKAAVAQTETDASQVQVDNAAAAEKSAGEALAAAQNSLAAAVAERASRAKALEAAKAALGAARAELAAKQSAFDTAISELGDRWTNDFTLASLKPLTPEQLCWTVFRVTGVYDRYWQAEAAELDKSQPLTDEQKQDPAQVAARQAEIEQRTFDKLKGNVAIFVTYYGAAAGQPQGDFFSTADQALFAANGGSVSSWAAPADGNVTDSVIKQNDPRAAAEELYLAALTRLPTEEESAAVVKHLTDRANDKSAAAQELVWGLLNSVEFRFNH